MSFPRRRPTGFKAKLQQALEGAQEAPRPQQEATPELSSDDLAKMSDDELAEAIKVAEEKARFANERYLESMRREEGSPSEAPASTRRTSFIEVLRGHPSERRKKRSW